MTEDLLATRLNQALVARGFATRRELAIAGTRFDIVAENDSILIFLSVRSANLGLLDDFYDQQTSMDAILTDLDLGQKWRDVYLLEVTTDAVDTRRELEVAEAVQSNTRTARKLVIDASGIDPDKDEDVENLLNLILRGPDVLGPAQDLDVLDSLKGALVKDGFSDQVVSRLLRSYTSDRHDCVKLLLEELTDETEEH